MSLAHLGQTIIPTKPQDPSVLIRGPRSIFYCLGMFDEHAKARKKRNKLEENDFYDSDEDEFFDRTGELSQKREKRKKAAGIKNNQKEKAMTHQEILDKLKDYVHNRYHATLKISTSLAQSDIVGQDGLVWTRHLIRGGRI